MSYWFFDQKFIWFGWFFFYFIWIDPIVDYVFFLNNTSQQKTIHQPSGVGVTRSNQLLFTTVLHVCLISICQRISLLLVRKLSCDSIVKKYWLNYFTQIKKRKQMNSNLRQNTKINLKSFNHWVKGRNPTYLYCYLP